ncbi:class F sortase [Streptomyces roseirectus]|uniref:class F sortase n=1 Tax=Streptomyces roseirectus TaxID=2768066 RepID=UPI003CCC9B42
MLSRRGFAVAGLGALLVGCGSGGEGVRVSSDDDGSVGTVQAAGGGETSGAAKRVGPVIPVDLRIPSIGVDTPLLSLGLAGDGTVEVPPVTAHNRAGWYRYSPAPGRTGPSVVLGHLTVGDYGPGVFHRLPELRRGDEITARLSDGGAPVFRVTSVRTVPKSAFPTREVYGDTARPELRLITCGGTRTGDGYSANVIVFAELERG